MSTYSRLAVLNIDVLRMEHQSKIEIITQEILLAQVVEANRIAVGEC